MTSRRPATARSHAARLAACVLAVILATAPPALALPGSLDSTFGTGGRVSTFTGSMEDAKGVAIQPDGRIVVAGGYYGTATSDLVVLRYGADGALDPTFDGDGIARADFHGNTDAAEAVAVAPDGRIVAAGHSTDPATSVRRFALARWLANGSLDGSFGSGGKVEITVGTMAYAYGLALQADGRIVVAGFTDAVGPGSNFAVARLESNGALDTTFGTGGVAVLSLGAGFFGNDDAFAVAVQPDGRIVVAGRAEAASGDFALARLTTNGTLDPTFDGDGVVYTDFIGTQDDAFAVVVQPDGHIVAGGFTVVSGSEWDFVLARYDANGSLDPSFGSGGRVRTSVGTTDYGQALALLPDGKIVLAGSSDGRFALARYQPSGYLDPSFGTGGIVTTPFPLGPAAANAVARQSDGALVVAGGVGSFVAQRNVAVARYDDVAHTTAVTAATGTWSLRLVGWSLAGTLAFDDQAFPVFGYSVNLGASIGSLAHGGSITGFNGTSGALTLTSAGGLGFTLQGTFGCAAAGCFSGDANDGAAFGPIAGGGLPPSGVVHALASQLAYDATSGTFTGPFTLTALAAANTPTGSGVTVNGPGISVQFSGVSAAGTTLIAPLASTPGPLPSNFEVLPPPLGPMWFEIATSATYQPPIEVCLSYPASLAGSAFLTTVALKHRVGTTWEDVPLIDQPATLRLCGSVTSLSPFAFGVTATGSAGFVPPDRAAERCSTMVAKAAATLARQLAACHVQAAQAAMAGRTVDLDGCQANAAGRFDAKRVRLEACAPCTTANAPVLRAETLSLISSLAGGVYCAGTQSLGAGQLGMVPPDAAAASCEKRLAAQAGRLVAADVGCQAAAAKAAARGAASDDDACEAVAESRYRAAVPDDADGCPGCVTANTAAIAAQIAGFVDRRIGALAYCAGTAPLR